TETVYDFGNARSDAGSITHTFSIRNNGKKALSIISALPSCGCTVADYDRKPFMPGQEGTVKVKLSLYGQKGEIQKDVKVRLKSASGASEQIVFALKGVVIPAE
ncbi:MAG: DUF1573 domain-containing protein, partial [Muribaculaceae bacterium]|nr:DUF1573 domain-containing protein [Muribaculaceae bacterium]